MSTFEDKCQKMASRAEIEASNCDQDLSAVDRATAQQHQKDLRQVLKQLEDMHLIQTGIDKLETKLDLVSSRWQLAQLLTLVKTNSMLDVILTLGWIYSEISTSG